MGKRGEWEGDQRGGERRRGEQGKSESWSAGVMQVEGDETLGLGQPIQGLAEIIIITTPIEGFPGATHILNISPTFPFSDLSQLGE